MLAYQLLQDDLSITCDTIHRTRLQAVFDVAAGLQKSQSLVQASMGRHLSGKADIKHKIKKVDRLEGNKLLHSELEQMYTGLSSFVFKYLTIEKHTPMIVDLCYIQDGCDIPMLSAEVALKGRTIPVYREVFAKNGLKGRANSFLEKLSECLPSTHDIVIIMDAGFGEDWISEIEKLQWNWILRIRRGKYVKFSEETEWLSAKDAMKDIGDRAKSHNSSYITKMNPHKCRIVTKGARKTRARKKPQKLPRNYNSGNGNYSTTHKEPWILATNLPRKYSAVQVLNYYKKRMQIEESFRDIKSPRYGLSARDARTDCIHRWGVKMLLAAIVQIVAWIIGIIGHSLNYQKKFQANTVKNKKVFSYFFLGQLIIEHDMLDTLEINYAQLDEIINKELAREW